MSQAVFLMQYLWHIYFSLFTWDSDGIGHPVFYLITPQNIMLFTVSCYWIFRYFQWCNGHLWIWNFLPCFTSLGGLLEVELPRRWVFFHKAFQTYHQITVWKGYSNSCSHQQRGRVLIPCTLANIITLKYFGVLAPNNDIYHFHLWLLMRFTFFVY